MPPADARPTLLVVHAHPDDESITTGGTLARYAAEGVRTVVVICTLGEAGETSQSTLAGGDPLGEVRRGELAAALRVLGVARLAELGYRDSGMAGTPQNKHPAAFVRAPLDEAVGRLVGLIRSERPTVVITYDESGGYGHPDHRRAHQITLAATTAAGSPDRYADSGEPWQIPRTYLHVTPRSWVERSLRLLRDAGIEAHPPALVGVGPDRTGPDVSQPDESVTARIDVGAYLALKRAAIAAHRSQMTAEHPLMRMPPEVAAEVWRYEYFRQLGAGRRPSDQPQDDLFAGIA